MIDRQGEAKCNGCKMCKDLCPHRAISYQVNSEGFWFPVVDYGKCVRCGICVEKCPNIHPIPCRTKEPCVYAAWSVDDDVRLRSTSGGMFYELARKTLAAGGCVTGCVYTRDFKGARQVLIEDESNLPPLLVSKYLQSDTENIYAHTREKVLSGCPVLFVGTPCHSAALVSYLGREYENLVICDFICRGVTSPKAHQKYIEWLEDRYDSRVVNVRSKDKRYGWNHFGQAVKFENGEEYFGTRREDPRIQAYHKNLMCRTSCHSCQFKQIPRVGADITLADFWGISPQEVEDVEKGISLVMLNTERGKSFFDGLGSRVKRVEKTLADAAKGNVAIYQSAPRSDKREDFLAQLDSMPFGELVKMFLKK